MQFKVVGGIVDIETVRLANGKLRRVELHWYEAHGIGRKDVKRKRTLREG